MHEEYMTYDLGEAAYLKLIGFSIEFMREEAKHINSVRVRFIFKGDAQLMKFKAMDFYEHRGKIDAKSYFDTLRSLKKTVFEILNNKK
jgi:hypothetical protein